MDTLDHAPASVPTATKPDAPDSAAATVTPNAAATATADADTPSTVAETKLATTATDTADTASGPPPPRHLLFCGSTKWDLLGRKTLPRSVAERGGTADGEDLLGPTRLLFPQLPTSEIRAVRTGPCAAHFVLVSMDGRAFGVGRNDNAQLACADLRAKAHPVALTPPLDSDDIIIDAACGRAHTILITRKGVAWAVGINAAGQLGIGSTAETRTPQNTDWRRVGVPDGEQVIGAAAGSEFSVFACKSGRVFSAGSGQYGQLGNGRTGECIESNNRIAFDVIPTPVQVIFDAVTGGKPGNGMTPKMLKDVDEVRIVQVAAGTNHTLALDSLGKVWSWGFGGYGRLGHRGPKDELRPRRIETFDPPHYKLDFVAAGVTSSFAVQRSRRSTYFWGITKKTGESFMYPKPLFDLQGWEVHSVASGTTSTVVAAERTVISWGPSPTYGELGYGKNEQKSSTKPKMMEAVDGLKCIGVAEGMAFTLLLVEAEAESERKILEGLESREIQGLEVGTKSKRKARDSGVSGSKGGKRKKKRR